MQFAFPGVIRYLTRYHKLRNRGSNRMMNNKLIPMSIHEPE